jgi:hypothetical protein
MHVYEVRPRKDRRGVDLMSDALPFGRLWYGEPNAVSNAIGYAKFFSRSHDAVIRVYDHSGNVIKTHEHKGDFKEFPKLQQPRDRPRSIVLYRRHGISKRRRNPRSGRSPSKTKKGRRERQVKKLFLVAFVVSGLAFVPVQRSDAQMEIGIPGIGTGPGVNYGYPHFEYWYYPRAGYYYQQPDYGYYRGPSYDSHHGHRAYSRHHRYHLHKASVGPISTI